VTTGQRAHRPRVERVDRASYRYGTASAQRRKCHCVFATHTVESHDTEETKVRGEDGRVHFAERKLHAIGLLRLLGAIRNLAYILIWPQVKGAMATQVLSTCLHKMSGKVRLTGLRNSPPMLCCYSARPTTLSWLRLSKRSREACSASKDALSPCLWLRSSAPRFRDSFKTAGRRTISRRQSV
jgi:hypothetical protein